MIQDERIDEVASLAKMIAEHANEIDNVVQAENRPSVKARMTKAMEHLHCFFDEIESLIRQGPTKGA